VAAALGISQQAYRKFETPGKSNPTLKTLGRLSEVLGLNSG
jgi:transcriptional regulator with XRE-family HTH domain